MQHFPEEYLALVQRFYAAVNDGIMWGDARAMLALWSERDDVSYCDPNGQMQRGRQELVTYWNHAAQVNSETQGNISATIDILAIQTSAEMVSIVVREHIHIQEDLAVSNENEEVGSVNVARPSRIRGMMKTARGAAPLKCQALATNIFRYEDQQWRMVHRHAGTPVEEA